MPKTDAEIATAITVGHDEESKAARFLRSQGLDVEVLSTGFRSEPGQIPDYAHDVDLRVQGALVQVKVRTVPSARFARLFVDEKTKADRTPVDFYLVRFTDTELVAPYHPPSWSVETHQDPADRSTKDYYASPRADWLSVRSWVVLLQSDWWVLTRGAK